MMRRRCTFRLIATLLVCVLMLFFVGRQVGSDTPGTKELHRIFVDGRWGLIDTDGRTVVPPKYRQITSYNGEAHVAEREDGTWVLVDADGESSLYAGRASSVFSLGDDLYRVHPLDLGGQGTVFDTREVFALPEGYESPAGPWREDRIPVRANGRWGFANRSGEVVIAPRFDLVSFFSEGMAPVAVKDEKGMKWGYVDRKGEVVIEPQYVTAGQFQYQLACVRDGEFYAYIKPDGSAAFPGRYASAGNFSEELAWATDGNSGLVGYIDTRGDWVISPQYGIGGDFSEGLAAVFEPAERHKQEESSRRITQLRFMGFINKAGDLAIPQRSDTRPGEVESLKDFERGMAWISLTGGYRSSEIGLLQGWARGYYINHQGEIVWQTHDIKAAQPGWFSRWIRRFREVLDSLGM